MQDQNEKKKGGFSHNKYSAVPWLRTAHSTSDWNSSWGRSQWKAITYKVILVTGNCKNRGKTTTGLSSVMLFSRHSLVPHIREGVISVDGDSCDNNCLYVRSLFPWARDQNNSSNPNLARHKSSTSLCPVGKYQSGKGCSILVAVQLHFNDLGEKLLFSHRPLSSGGWTSVQGNDWRYWSATSGHVS